MTLKDVVDLLFSARERIDFYWNFYVVVVIAIIGWLLTLRRPLTRRMKVVVSITYVVAALMNLIGLYGSYTFAEALRTDLLRMAAATALTDTRLVLERHSYLAGRTAAIWIHLVLGAAILFAIWFVRHAEHDAIPSTTDNANQQGRTSAQ